MNYRPRLRPGWYSYRAQNGSRCWVRLLWVVPNQGASNAGDWWVTFASPVTDTHSGWVWEELRVSEFTASMRRGNPPAEVKGLLYRSPMWKQYLYSQWELARARRAAS